MKWLRTFRLLLATWRARVLAAYYDLELRFRQQTCPHSYRAALVEGEPGRVCRMCDASERLTREEFYAQFGERYQALLNARR